jgi:hypothetical protein
MPETSHRGSRASKAEGTEPEAASSEQQATTTSTEQTKPTEEGAPQSDVLVSQLVDRAPEFLGYPTHTAMGALSGDLDEMMTPEAAKSKVEEWLNQPVKVDEPDEEG